MTTATFVVDDQGRLVPGALRPVDAPAAPPMRPLEVIELELLEAQEGVDRRETVTLPGHQAALERERSTLGDVDARLAELHDRVVEAIAGVHARQRREGVVLQAAWSLSDSVVSGPPGWGAPRDEVLDLMRAHQAIQVREWAVANQAVLNREALVYRLTAFEIPGWRRRVGELEDEFRRAQSAARTRPDDLVGVRARLDAVRARLGKGKGAR